MLASLLPGFREVRSPLVAGYLWLVAIWVALDRLGLRDDLAESDAAAALDALTKQLSVAGVAVAGSFAAYVLGAIWEAGVAAVSRSGYVETSDEARQLAEELARRWFRETDVTVRRKLGVSEKPWLGQLIRVIETADLQPSQTRSAGDSEGEGSADQPGGIQEKKEKDILGAIHQAELSSPRDQWWSETEIAETRYADDFVREIAFAVERLKLGIETVQRGERWDRRSEPLGTEPLVCAKRADSSEIKIVTYDNIRQTIINDLPLTARRLVGEQQEIYLELDRMNAEVGFRFTVAVPLLAALVSVGLTLPLGLGIATVVTGIVVAAALILDGFRRDRDRNDVLIDLIRIDKATSPTLARIGVRAEAISDPSSTDGNGATA